MSFCSEETISVLCLTYNVNGRKLVGTSKDLQGSGSGGAGGASSASRARSGVFNDADLLQFSSAFDCSGFGVYQPDVIAVGLEETIEMSAADIGSTVIMGSLADVVDHWNAVVPLAINYHAGIRCQNTTLSKDDSKDSDFIDTENIRSTYVEIANIHMMGIWSGVYCKSEIRPHISVVSTATHARGVGGVLGNKGGVYVSFCYHNTSICMITAHLAAHQNHVKERNEDFKAISLANVFEDREIRICAMDIYDHEKSKRKPTSYRAGMAPVQVQLIKLRDRLRVLEHQQQQLAWRDTDNEKLASSDSAAELGSLLSSDAQKRSSSSSLELAQQFMGKGESIIIASVLGKKNPYGLTQSRLLVLTDKPRLIYIDPKEGIKKGEIVWNEIYPVRARRLDAKSFEVGSTPDEKTYQFSLKDEISNNGASNGNSYDFQSTDLIEDWITAINQSEWRTPIVDLGEEDGDDYYDYDTGTAESNEISNSRPNSLNSGESKSGSSGAPSLAPKQSVFHEKVESYCALDHDIVFFMGDLNYRISNLDIDTVYSYLDSGDFWIAKLHEHDQLNAARATNVEVVSQFQEGELTFPPTYKFIPMKGDKELAKDVETYGSLHGPLGYDRRPDKKMRIPAWCDRVLWKVRHLYGQPSDGISKNWRKSSSLDEKDGYESVQLMCYEMLKDYFISDHKPVRSLFSLRVKKIDFAKREENLCLYQKSDPTAAGIADRLHYQIYSKIKIPYGAIKPSGLRVYHNYLFQKSLFSETAALSNKTLDNFLTFKIFNYTRLHSVRLNTESSSYIDSGTIFYEDSHIPNWLNITCSSSICMDTGHGGLSRQGDSIASKIVSSIISEHLVSRNLTSSVVIGPESFVDLTFTIVSDPFTDSAFMAESHRAFESVGECSLLLGIDLFSVIPTLNKSDAVVGSQEGRDPADERRLPSRYNLKSTIIFPIHIFKNSSHIN